MLADSGKVGQSGVPIAAAIMPVLQKEKSLISVRNSNGQFAGTEKAQEVGRLEHPISKRGTYQFLPK